ncbi:MAG: nitroreductase family protein [Candidatus Roseilinea sp.]|uniref:nitroreductase family protein n=1 Tax=Candidatus Roseilinea sp. TaxID=2838777 RepID=UPI00404B76DB
MNKPTPAEHDIHPLVHARWSPRAFDSHPLEASQILSLFEAARWSPSGGNNQPWAFVLFLADGSEQRRQIEDALTGNNRDWAPRAPLLVLAVALPHPRVGKLGPYSYYYDLGQSVAHLTVQATSMGLFVHQMAGFEADKAKRARQPACLMTVSRWSLSPLGAMATWIICRKCCASASLHRAFASP